MAMKIIQYILFKDSSKDSFFNKRDEIIEKQKE